jgi:aspartyl protease family protein
MCISLHVWNVRMPHLLLGLIFASCVSAATGQTVSLSGSLGTSKALLIIDGVPRTVAAGGRVQNVKVISVGSGEALP